MVDWGTGYIKVIYIELDVKAANWNPPVLHRRRLLYNMTQLTNI
jgi:hypothetical protein